MFGLLLVFLFIVFLSVSRNNARNKISARKGTATKINKKIINMGYKVRYSVLNKSETVFFLELQKQIPESFYVFPKMRIADILETLNGAGYYKRRNVVLPKHIDFLICDKNFKPILAVELDGGSHQRQDRKERDILINDIFEQAGIRLHRISVGRDFLGEVGKLVSTLNN